LPLLQNEESQPVFRFQVVQRRADVGKIAILNLDQDLLLRKGTRKRIITPLYVLYCPFSAILFHNRGFLICCRNRKQNLKETKPGCVPV